MKTKCVLCDREIISKEEVLVHYKTKKELCVRCALSAIIAFSEGKHTGEIDVSKLIRNINYYLGMCAWKEQLDTKTNK